MLCLYESYMDHQHIESLLYIQWFEYSVNWSEYNKTLFKAITYGEFFIYIK